MDIWRDKPKNDNENDGGDTPNPNLGEAVRKLVDAKISNMPPATATLHLQLLTAILEASDWKRAACAVWELETLFRQAPAAVRGPLAAYLVATAAQQEGSTL